MKKILSYFFLFIFSFLAILLGCNNTTEVEIHGIVTPLVNWYYRCDDVILFSSDIKNENIQWYSSVDGFLGTGKTIYSFLTSGHHEISLIFNDVIYKKIEIDVYPSKLLEKSKCLLIQEFPYSFIPKKEIFGFFTEDCNVHNLSVVNSLRSEGEINNSFLSRDISIDSDINQLSRINYDNVNISDRSTENNAYKLFNVINTANQLEVHYVNGTLFYSSSKINVFVEDAIDIETIRSNLESCIYNFEKIIYPRICSIWGEPYDLDKNGRTTVLFSSTINEENTAVGFFNKNDFYKKIEDKEHESYNPFSNEMDIIYLGLPDDSNMNYSVGSISATFAHEITHLINFYYKTFSKSSDNTNCKTMDSFLDEGLSHISESILGFGDSGGNYKFINYYVNSSLDYSFCKKDILNRTDSIGLRGASCLFIYYLFEKAGGITWTENGFPEDAGGISFLRSVINSDNYGWDALGSYYKKSTDILFREFCHDLFEKKLCEIFDFDKRDPITKEAIFHCNEFKRYNLGNKRILPYSFGFFEIPYSPIPTHVELNSDIIIGNFYLMY